MSDINIKDIIIADRTRKDMGQIEILMRSIKDIGLMQPIGVNKKNELLFGHRRYLACKGLGWETIPCNVFEIDADDRLKPLKMERHENEIRKEMTPSEKVAIAEKIEEALKGRWGSNQHQKKEEVQNIAPPSQGKSVDIASKSVGLNRETYRQAKQVVKSGNEEAIQRMNSGEAISKVYKETIKKVEPKPSEKVLKNPEPKTIEQEIEVKPKTIKITLYNNPVDGAMEFIQEAGNSYSEKLAISVLKILGHKIEIDHK